MIRKKMSIVIKNNKGNFDFFLNVYIINMINLLIAFIFHKLHIKEANKITAKTFIEKDTLEAH